MTKSEYMEQLRKKLKSFSRELQEDIMDDYRQHFTEGELQGKTEEEIIRELGNIEDMIRDLPESDLKENMLYPFPDSADISQKTLKNNTKSGTEPNAGSGFKSDAEAKTDNGFKSNEENENTFVYSGNYDAIELSGEAADLFLLSSEDDRIHVECVNRSQNPSRQYEYYQYEENGTFYAGFKRTENPGNRTKQNGGSENRESNGKEKSLKVTLFGQTIIAYTNMRNRANTPNPVLTVRIPDNKVSRLHAKASSGGICLTGLTQKALSLESLSGDIKADSVTSDTLQIQASSGDITLNDLVLGKNLTLRTLSGDLHLKTVSVPQRTEIKVSSGDVDITGLSGQELQLVSLSGDIRLTDISSDVLNACSTSGDMCITSVNCQTLNAESFSGDMCITSVNCQTLNTKSSSGDIRLTGTTFKTGSISARSGDLSLSELRFETGNITSVQGDITCADTDFENGSFTAESGDISGTNTKTACGIFTAKKGDIILRDNGGGDRKKYKCSTESGDIHIQSDAEIYECAAHGGDISVNASGTLRCLSLRSSWGDLSANTYGTPEKVELQSGNGDICLNMSKTEGMEVNMDCGWGDSRVRWEGESRNFKKGTCSYGNGACKVTVRSARGDVTISGSSR